MHFHVQPANYLEQSLIGLCSLYCELYLRNRVISELMVNIRKYISCMHKLAEGVSILDLIVSFTHACSISSYGEEYY